MTPTKEEIMKIVKLHGGPMHGKKIELENGQDHFHVAEPVQLPEDFYAGGGPDPAITEVPFREGMYSQVAGCPEDYEWDGWRTH
jgi:hypothetical protein